MATVTAAQAAEQELANNSLSQAIFRRKRYIKSRQVSKGLLVFLKKVTIFL